MARFRSTPIVLSLLGSGLFVTACGPAAEPRLDGSEEFRRICSVTLATDEILAELVPAERLVGVTYMVDDPGISNVVGHYPASITRVDANLELILDVNPDLVLVAPYTQAGFREVLRRSGLRVFRYEQNDAFDSVMEGIRTLGDVVGEPQRAADLIGRMQARLGELDRTVAAVTTRPRVLYWARGWTAGGGTNVDDMIERAGGINVAAELGMSGHPQAPLEVVLTSDPDFLLVPDWSDTDGDRQAEVPGSLRTLRAVKEGRVIVIEGRFISAASQYVVEGAEHLARLLHPEAFDPGSPADEPKTGEDLGPPR